METVVVSSNYEVEIPSGIRESLSIHPGQKIQVIQYQNRIELIPIQSPREMRGFLAGIDTTIQRESDRV